MELDVVEGVERSSEEVVEEDGRVVRRVRVDERERRRDGPPAFAREEEGTVVGGPA